MKGDDFRQDASLSARPCEGSGKAPAGGPESILIGTSDYIRRIKEEIVQLGRTDLPVLIVGETGTGKDLIARMLHEAIPRKEFDYVPINCPALGTLAASELFGHSKGAFTGADRSTTGLIGAAENGSLFLDEIGDLSLEIQAMLLRFLENREYVRVGEARIRKGNVRILSASNYSLEDLCEEKKFRWDLLYRISGAVIETEPLRQHKNDIPILIQHFLEEVEEAIGKEIRFTPDAVTAMLDYHWPGNVRQLKYVVHYAAHRCRSREVRVEDIEGILRRNFKKEPLKTYKEAKSENLRNFDLEYFTRLLTLTNGRVKEALVISGLHKKNFYAKLSDLGISPAEFRS